MVRFSNIVIAYFVIGAVMWGGGAIAYGNSGLAQEFIDISDGSASGDQGLLNSISNMDVPILSSAASAATGLIAIWGILEKIIAFLFWPLTIVATAGFPLRIQVLVGGVFMVGFLMSLLRVIRGSV